ncbi:MAG: TrkA family potassium uptake protein [Muribaculaceae bacterium]|nr:TrkA family potassium uptake protein [Muribaculaceae bacterium]
MDLVIVAIGENFGASIKTVALLKQAGVKHIFARATDQLHEAILQGLQVDRILTPEQQAAFTLTQELALGSETGVMKVTDDSYVMQFKAPDYFIGQKYNELTLLNDYNITLIAASRSITSRNIIGISSPTLKLLDLGSDSELSVQPNDMFTCFATSSAYRSMRRQLE